MTRSIRNNISSATAALCPASFGTFLWLFFSYFASHPAMPNAELGLVNALNNHGAHVYVSDRETTGLTLLMWMFFVGLLATLTIVPKDPVLPAPTTPRWITFIGARARIDLANPTPRLKAIFLCSFAFYLAAICFVGPSLVRFIVAHGIVLHL
jgi:hypothetical protein